MVLRPAGVPELVDLLDNDRRVYYAGSQETTLGNHYAYRVRDLAAYFLGRIRGVDVELAEDPWQRDKAIAAIRTDLAGGVE